MSLIGRSSKTTTIDNTITAPVNILPVSDSYVVTHDLAARTGLDANWTQYGIFAYNDNVPTTETTTAKGLPINNIYRLTFPVASTKMKVASTSALDTAAGTGARTIVIEYLDTNFNPLTETLTLNGTTAVETTASMFRINAFFTNSAGSTRANQGYIYIIPTADSFDAGGIPTGSIIHHCGGPIDNFSYCGIITVPINRNYYSIRQNGSTDATAVKPVIRKLYKRFPAFDVPFLWNIDYFTSGAIAQQDLFAGAKHTAGTDLEETSQSVSGVSTMKDFLIFNIEKTNVD